MLEEIVAYKREETRQRREQYSGSELLRRIARARPVRDLAAALAQPGFALIAEVKYRSPSKGILRGDFDPVELAFAYQGGGAHAVSVLADSRFFGGGPFVVKQVANLAGLTLPVMYKDFIIDPWQVQEARACGADAVLLIARIQPPQQLRRLVEQCRELEMCPLVECFDECDIAAALDSRAGVVGINNRDLGHFGVDFSRTERLHALLPDSVLAVTESGLVDRAAVLRMQRLGFQAALVGEALVSAPEPAHAVATLLGRRET